MTTISPPTRRRTFADLRAAVVRTFRRTADRGRTVLGAVSTAAAPVVGRIGRAVGPDSRVGRPVWAVIRPVTSTVSALGWSALVAAGLLGWAGLHYAWLEAIVIAVLLVAAMLVGVVFVLGRFRYTVLLDLTEPRVTVGDRALGRLDVRNESARALLPAVMELPVGQSLGTFPVPRLAPGAAHESIFTVPTHRRSVITIGPVRSVRADPFGLLRRQVVWSGPQELFVHPRVQALSGSSTGFLRDLEGRVTQDISDSDVSFHALRGYVPGDDRRHIHWKTTARTGELMVRQFEETRRSHLAVILSTGSQDYADAEEFELAVSACGSLGLQAIREDRGVTVLVHEGSLRGTHRTQLLDDLSRVELRSAKRTLVDVARVAGATILDASVIAFVLGSAASPAVLRAAAARLPQDVRVLAVQCIPGAAVSRRVVSELTVLTVGELGDLPVALRSVQG